MKSLPLLYGDEHLFAQMKRTETVYYFLCFCDDPFDMVVDRRWYTVLFDALNSWTDSLETVDRTLNICSLFLVQRLKTGRLSLSEHHNANKIRRKKDHNFNIQFNLKIVEEEKNKRKRKPHVFIASCELFLSVMLFISTSIFFSWLNIEQHVKGKSSRQIEFDTKWNTMEMDLRFSSHSIECRISFCIFNY